MSTKDTSLLKPIIKAILMNRDIKAKNILSFDNCEKYRSLEESEESKEIFNRLKEINYLGITDTSICVGDSNGNALLDCLNLAINNSFNKKT